MDDAPVEYLPFRARCSGCPEITTEVKGGCSESVGIPKVRIRSHLWLAVPIGRAIRIHCPPGSSPRRFLPINIWFGGRFFRGHRSTEQKRTTRRWRRRGLQRSLGPILDRIARLGSCERVAVRNHANRKATRRWLDRVWVLRQRFGWGVYFSDLRIRSTTSSNGSSF